MPCVGTAIAARHLTERRRVRKTASGWREPGGWTAERGNPTGPLQTRRGGPEDAREGHQNPVRDAEWIGGAVLHGVKVLMDPLVCAGESELSRETSGGVGTCEAAFATERGEQQRPRTGPAVERALRLTHGLAGLELFKRALVVSRQRRVAKERLDRVGELASLSSRGRREERIDVGAQASLPLLLECTEQRPCISHRGAP